MTVRVALAALLLIAGCESPSDCAGPYDTDCSGSLDIAEAPPCETCDVRCDEASPACFDGDERAADGIGTSCSTSQDIEDHYGQAVRCDGAIPVCYRVSGDALPTDLETPRCVDTR